MTPRPFFVHHKLFVREAFLLTDNTIYILLKQRHAGHKTVCVEKDDRFHCQVTSPNGKVFQRHLVNALVGISHQETQSKEHRRKEKERQSSGLA